DLHHVAAEGVVRAEAVVEVDGRLFTGKSQEVDIADAAVAAFIAAINQAAVMRVTSNETQEMASVQ
ncbi:MAG: hypothetical protein JKX88_00175, partial [Marinicaulis sp.]|nr:hypothetical protein [Marinicaulis sp.]